VEFILEKTFVQGALTDRNHWDKVWTSSPRLKLPSSLIIGTRNLQQLLLRKVNPGDRFIEIGCAPGKLLAWVAARLCAQVAGIDYSPQGVEFTGQLFEHLKLSSDVRCEDFFSHSFEPGTFDCVFSAGFIEHFDDPTDVVNRHVELARPGGRIIITVPHYGGIYGRLQRLFDPGNLAIHNTRIMSVSALQSLVPDSKVRESTAYAYGRMSPWIVSLEARIPPIAARMMQAIANGFAMLQPFDIEGVCPLLVLEMQRREA
jgi:2-polyprenyl-3-methyl-5-hydroxy-6-metoxy-1,4-benzoquinol methylase